MKEVPIAYGINNFRLNGTDILIIRAELPSEVAGHGDIYTVMYKQEEKWNLVQYPNHTFNTSAWPHTEEDAVSTAAFFATEKTGNGLEMLYLLRINRAFEDSIADRGIATFELHKVQKNNELGFFEFQKIDHLKTEIKYGNIDCALKDELGISLSYKASSNSRCVERTP